MNPLLLSGSFHSKSKSLMLIEAIKKYLDNYSCDTPFLDSLPYFSEDLNHDKPACIQNFLSLVEHNSGIIFVTPEYNHSIPAVLKNAIDWASRPAFFSPLKGKPVTFITQTDSLVGGARAQAHLKLVLDSTLSHIYPSHELIISGISQAIGPDAQITDEIVQKRLKRHVEGFLAFMLKMGGAHAA